MIKISKPTFSLLLSLIFLSSYDLDRNFFSYIIILNLVI